MVYITKILLDALVGVMVTDNPVMSVKDDAELVKVSVLVALTILTGTCPLPFIVTGMITPLL
jgi:hypothetical protein